MDRGMSCTGKDRQTSAASDGYDENGCLPTDAEWNKLMDENKKYCDALHIIAYMGVSGLSWQYDFENCVNIANEALGLARKNL